MTDSGRLKRPVTGTPQGGIASPLLANIALSALDRCYQQDWQQTSATANRRHLRRRKGLPTYRLIRYADDLVIVVHGSRPHADIVLAELHQRVAALGLTLKRDKTRVTHVDEGFVFLGQRIIRRAKGRKRYVYTFVSDEALASIKAKVKALTGRSTTNLDLEVLLRRLNLVLRGWASYFRYAAAQRTFDYLGYYAWWRVVGWLRKKHPRMAWKQLRRRYSLDARGPQKGEIKLYNPASMRIERYRHRGAKISTPWNKATLDPTGARFRRTRHDDPAFLTALQEALA